MRSETPLNVISEKTSYRKILGHSSIYVAGVMISKLVGFVMIPIYTHYLSPADYGTLELLSTTTDVLAILIGIGLAQAVLRFYYDFNDRERQNEVVSTALIASIVCFLIIFGLLTLRSDFISKLVFGSKDLTYYFQIMFISMVFSSGIEIPLTYLRAQQRSVYFVTVNLVRLIIQLSLNIYFIVVLGYGVLGVLYSGLIASVLIGIYMTVVTLRDTGFNFSFVRLKDLFRFGYPLIFSHLGAFVLTYSDRYFLKHFADLTEVGIYSLAYKFGMIVSALLIVPFHQFWMAEMFAVAKREDARQFLQRHFYILDIPINSVLLCSLRFHTRDYQTGRARDLLALIHAGTPDLSFVYFLWHAEFRQLRHFNQQENAFTGIFNTYGGRRQCRTELCPDSPLGSARRRHGNHWRICCKISDVVLVLAERISYRL